MFRKILVPLDGSPLSEQALPYALHAARQADATLDVALVHVPEAYGDFAAPHTDDSDIEAKGRERAYLDALRDRLPPAAREMVEIHHLEGIVQEALAAEVAERGIDLVMMNAHGWGYTQRALVGSVSDYLMRHLTVPLLLMHSPASDGDLNRPASFRRILIPLDGSTLAESILEPAQMLGGLSQAEYRLLRVVPSPRQFAGSPGDHTPEPGQHVIDKTTADSLAYLKGVAQGMGNQAAAVETSVTASQNVAAAIVDEATTSGCDLIAIATHGRGGLSRLLLGSVADKVIRAAHTPVLVYRSE